ncbi:MAG: hypothetical protein ACHQF2_02855, partial [Flavobacteriales bacterium]
YTLDENALLVKTTRFWYARQKSYPPAESNRDFDCEALLVRNDTAYLFTKTWSKPYKGISYQYVLPVTADSVFSLHPVDSFATGKNNYLEGSITGCDLSPGRKYFALTSCNYLYVFFDFEKNNFLQGNYAVFRYETTSQREAIAFDTDSTFYVTDERWANLVGGYLYSFNLEPFLDGRIEYAVPDLDEVIIRRSDTKYWKILVQGRRYEDNDKEMRLPNADSLKIELLDNSRKMVYQGFVNRVSMGSFMGDIDKINPEPVFVRVYDKKQLIYSGRLKHPRPFRD